MSNNRPICFISYAYADKVFLLNKILPILYQLDVQIWTDFDQVSIGDSIKDSILEGIRKADIIIALFNERSIYVNFEIGAAVGLKKPIIAITTSPYNIPLNLKELYFIQYVESNENIFIERLRHLVSVTVDQIINKSVFALADKQKVVGIKIGTNGQEIEREFRITADLVSLIRELTDSKEILLLDTSKGSLKSFIGIDLKHWPTLIEKILFFIPEWQRKRAEVKKIEVEIELIKIKARIADENFKIEKAAKIIQLLHEYKELGIKIQFDEDILLSLTSEGILEVREPVKIREEIQNR